MQVYLSFIILLTIWTVNVDSCIEDEINFGKRQDNDFFKMVAGGGYEDSFENKRDGVHKRHESRRKRRNGLRKRCDDEVSEDYFFSLGGADGYLETFANKRHGELKKRLDDVYGLDFVFDTNEKRHEEPHKRHGRYRRKRHEGHHK